ncbi:hypothetical protein L596_002451 [Steinernema carpocapsae]|uniref:C2H2-type domain-containing protein n=1 Tax=Steinernema carpocapsae TaxID=34508 RepID=A0A4U8UT74_STECR|nr:hypothetical protein L596_002451 [Steinernema carpocapsae]
MENGQQAAILYDQYVTDPNSYNLSDGPHCDDQLLDNAVADLLDNPLTEIDTSDLSALNPPISQSPVTTAPPMAPPQPSPMLPRSSEVSGQKTPEPSIHQCESCSKVVCSSRSLKRHRSTCKKYLDQFGHLLEDPQVKLSAIGTCTVKTGGTNVCEACSRQLCSASNLKRHRATCKAFQTNGDADTDATLGDEGESGQSDSLKSEVEETAKGTPKSAVSFDACSSTTDAMMSLSASISEKPWITVGEHLRAQHNQKQRELQQQRMSTGPTPKKPEFMIEDSKRIDRILADQDAVPSGRMAPTAELLMREIPSPAAPLASIITTEPLSPDRLSAAYGLRQDKPAEKAPSAAVLTAMKAAKPASLQASSAAKKESKDDLRYECPECSKTYSCRKNVKRHRMSVHKLTIEQLQKSKPVRVVVVSATDSSSVTTYAPAAGSAVSTNVVPKTKPVVNPASTSAPLNNPASSTDASSITVEVSSTPVSFEIEASAPVSIVCEPVSTMEQWKEPAQMMQSPSFEIQLPQSSDAPVESSTFDGDLNDMDGCDYSKEILEKSKFSELAEADTTFSEEVDELGVRRPSFSKRYQTSLRSQKTLSVRQLNVSLPPPPAVSATPTSAVTQSLPPSPKIATKRTATSSASTSIAPRTAESKRPKPLHVCEACNKSLSSDYSLKRHKSTCVHYKAAMEAKSSSSNATVDENKTIESKEIGDVKTEEKPVAEISKTKVPDSETVTKTNSAALELKPEPIDPSFDYRWQDSLGSTVDSSADNGSAEASASDNADAEVSDCTDVQIEKKEEESAEGEKTLSESLLCQEVLHDDFKQDIGEEWFDPSNVSSHPPVSADADSTTTSSSSSVKSDSVVVPKKENGTSSGTNSRKRAVWDESSDDQCDGCAVDSAYEEDEGAEDEDGKPSPKRIKIEPTEDQSTDFGKVTLPTAFTPHSLRENTVPAHINHSITSVIDGDAILYAGKYYFEIPKKFLINNSLVFRELSLTDATVDAFMLPDHISATAFESALGVLTKQVELDDENLESMLHVAARLKIVPLRRMCRDFIKSQIDETNLLWGIRLADQYELYSLKERLIESAKLEHLVDFHENEEYPNMSPKLRAELLARWSKFL